MSTAKKTHVLFANQCVENKSVHISFEHMNIQIPAVQLGLLSIILSECVTLWQMLILILAIIIC